MQPMLLHHPLFQTLRELKGNPRVTVLTEVMFGIPYNLFAPFFSVYMLALGVTDQQIGSIASLGLLLQIFTAVLSGAIVDKFGRRLTLFIADMLCWSVPCLIWAVAQDVRYFTAAGREGKPPAGAETSKCSPRSSLRTRSRTASTNPN